MVAVVEQIHWALFVGQYVYHLRQNLVSLRVNMASL